MSKPRWNTDLSAKALVRLRREIDEALKVPQLPMTKEEAFRGFTDEEPLSPEEARENIKDSGGF